MRLRNAARKLACAAPLVVVANIAQAADLFDDDYLRGAFVPPSGFKPYDRWDGPYFGADIGRSRLNANFNDNVSSLLENFLRGTTIENEAHVSKMPDVHGSGTGNIWGGFVGYNWQISPDLVVGVEGAYHMAPTAIRASGSDVIGRSFTTSGGTPYDINLTSRGQLDFKDYGTFRGRAGYVWGQFLPYAGLGVSVARVSYRTSTDLDLVQNSVPPVTVTQTLVSEKNNAIAYGANFALGVDVTLLPNMFLRGEYEYVAFAPVNGIRANLSTFRVGLGAKF
jgi:opacity protein-like surface antigen